MIDYQYSEKTENDLLSDNDRSLLTRLSAFTKYHSLWFRIFLFIFFIIICSFIIIYLYNWFYIQPKPPNSNLSKS